MFYDYMHASIHLDHPHLKLSLSFYKWMEVGLVLNQLKGNMARRKQVMFVY
jgi:hypothetical protein